MSIIKDEFDSILSVYEGAVESLKGMTLASENAVFWGGLPAIASFHARSARHLLFEGLPSEKGEGEYKRPYSSVLSLSRSTLEALGQMAYLLLTYSSDDEMKFRSYHTKIYGLTVRQNFQVFSKLNQLKLGSEAQTLNQLKSSIKQTQTFQDLTEKQQKQLLEGEWQPPKKKLLRELGFDEKSSKLIYEYLSEYAHSGFIASSQLVGNIDDIRAGHVGLSFVAMGLALVVRKLEDKFQQVKDYLQELEEGRNEIQDWLKAAQFAEQGAKQ